MAKTKKLKKQQIKRINFITICIAALLGIVAIAMAFLPATIINNTSTAYTGLNLTFGYNTSEKFLTSTIVTNYFAFSFLNLLTYILAIVGVVLIVLSLFKKGGKLIPFIAFVCFIIAGVFFFFQPQFSLPLDAVELQASAANPDLENIIKGTFNAKSCFNLGVGAIIAGITSILAGISSLIKTFVK